MPPVGCCGGSHPGRHLLEPRRLSEDSSELSFQLKQKLAQQPRRGGPQPPPGTDPEALRGAQRTSGPPGALTGTFCILSLEALLPVPLAQSLRHACGLGLWGPQKTL